MLYNFSEDFLNNLKPTEYLVPKIYHPFTRTILNTTSEKNLRHLKNVEILLPMKTTELTLELQLNHKIMSKSFKQIYNNKNGTTKANQPNITHLDYCHYTGGIKYRMNSWVALSTCNGINGIIFDGTKYYFIEKLSQNDAGIHQIYISAVSVEQKNQSSTRSKRDTHHKVLGGPYNENEDSRYIEFTLVFDNQVYKILGGVTETTRYAIQVVNLINAYYSRVNIFVVLVGVVIWTEQDEFFLETGTILEMFTNYAKTKLMKEFYFDSAHLISSINVIKGGIGVAGVGTVCDYTCTGVSDYLNNVLGTALTVAHELGHNLGMSHDTIDCTCPENQCIMVEVRSYNTMTHFSSCSVDTLLKNYESGKHYCLKNKPEVISRDLSSCGNGILEYGEECDCGLATYCENHCCDPKTCTFINNSQCASGPCCDLNTCKLKDAAIPCRPASNECDLSEYCTGDSHNCPEDSFKLDTEKCNYGQSYCHQGFCGSESKCSALSTIPNKRYLECYKIDSHLVNENNYCKSNVLNDAVFKCNEQKYFTTCSHPKYELIMWGSKSVIIDTSIYGNQGSIIACTLTMINDKPEEVHDATLCDKSQVQCLTMSQLRKQVPSCPVDCHNNGWCNNKGQCHCRDGYAPPDCSEPGFGGSYLSGPSTNPYGFILVRNIMFMLFLGIVPFIGLTVMTYHIIKEKYGTLGEFLKQVLRSKKHIPTISKTMSQQDSKYQKHRMFTCPPVPNSRYPQTSQRNAEDVDGTNTFYVSKPTNLKPTRSSNIIARNSNSSSLHQGRNVSTLHRVVNKTGNHEPHYQRPNSSTNAVTNPLYDIRPRLFNFLKRLSLRKSDPPYSNQVETIENQEEIGNANHSNIFKNNQYSSSKNVQQMNVKETGTIKRHLLVGINKISENREPYNNVQVTNNKVIISPAYNSKPKSVGLFAMSSGHKSNSTRSNVANGVESKEDSDYVIISSKQNNVDKVSAHFIPKKNQQVKINNVKTIKLEETQIRNNKTNLSTGFNKKPNQKPINLKKPSGSNFVNQRLTTLPQQHNSNASNSHSLVNKNMKQHKFPITPLDITDNPGHSETSSLPTQKTMDPLAITYYDEFAKKKKKLINNPTILNQQKTENLTRPFHGAGSSESENSKISVIEMIQKFNN